MKRTAAALFAASTVIAMGGLQGTASAANSEVSPMGWPTGCTFGRFTGDDAAAQAICNKSNGGSYRAVVICAPLDGGKKIVREPSVWKTSGYSYVFCPPMTMYSSSGINQRATH